MTPEVEEDVLDVVNETPGVITQVGVSHSTVWWVLREQQLYVHNVQDVQALSIQEYPACGSYNIVVGILTFLLL
jgi:hypothetical protein